MSAVKNLVAEPVGAWRRWVVLAVLGLGACTVLGRAFQLQVMQRDFLTHEGDKRAVRTVDVPAHRGAVRDRRGEPLALSAPVESVWTIPSELLAAPEYLPAMAKLLEMSARELRAFLTERKEKQFVYLRRQMDPDEAKRILALKAPGVFSQREYRRYYPAGEVTSQLVGFCDVDGRGQEGMEVAQDKSLRGKTGSRRVVRDRAGRIVEEDADFEKAVPGSDLTLAIDLRLQYLAYRELKAAVAKNRAKGGLVVVADVLTGEVLAIASQPGFNPNRSDERISEGRRNRAVVDLFEPGSTVKPLLIARALELGTFKPQSYVDTTPGFFKLGALTVRDVHPQGNLNLAGILSHSSNVGAAKIGLALGPQAVWAGYQKFGLGDPVASGFPGEAQGVLRPSGEWGQIATATASYGYGLSVNALQLVRAYAGLANDGLMPQLTLTLDHKSIPPQRAVTPEIAREVRRLMEQVVSDGGTGVKAAVAGYRVAGKTGTVRKIGTGGYRDDRHQSVFIGMVPARTPRLVGLVMIDEPGTEVYYGGLVAAPVFSRVMQGAARLLQLAPDEEPALTTTALRGTVAPRT